MHDLAKDVLCTVAFTRHAQDGFDVGASFTSLVQPARQRVQAAGAAGPQLLKTFKEQVTDVLNERDLEVIQSIEKRVVQEAVADSQRLAEAAIE